MTNWTETYRGAVPPWEYDVTEHFTIGYYFDRFEEADANLADTLGFSDLPRRPEEPVGDRLIRALETIGQLQETVEKHAQVLSKLAEAIAEMDKRLSALEKTGKS
jgi:hypothetical protein